MTRIRPAAAFVVLVLLSACSSLPSPVPGKPAVWPSARIEVITDPHILAPSLVSGEADWRALEDASFQIFREGPAVLKARVDAWMADRPSLVIITGDLTREGERPSHEEAVRILSPLRAAGIPVLVIPGNHDVLNPGAARPWLPAVRAAASVTPAEFAALWDDFGYRTALSRDPSSLSYLAEPIPGLRVLALDTARYEENAARGRQVTGGRIRDASWPWIARMLDDAARDGVPVITLMHHGLIEKFPKMGGLFADYLVADRAAVLDRFAARGVGLVLTGHFHTLSAAWADSGGRRVLELENGTLSQYPLGWRTLNFTPGSLKVTTNQVTGYPGAAPDFLEKARRLALGGTTEKLEGILRRSGVGSSDARKLTERFAEAFAAVTAGDPVKPAGWTWPPEGLGAMGSLAAAALGDLPQTLWTPTAPQDRTLDLVWPLPPAPAAR